MLSIFSGCSKFRLDGIFELIEHILKVLPNQEIAEIKAPFPHSEAIYLDTIADKTSDKVWTLNPDEILIAYEKGRSIEEVKEFLLSKNDQDLPDNILPFFNDYDKAKQTALR